MSKKEKYETCRHVISIGQLAVFVKPTCRNATIIKGTLVSSKPRCRNCHKWEERQK